MNTLWHLLGSHPTRLAVCQPHVHPSHAASRNLRSCARTHVRHIRCAVLHAVVTAPMGPCQPTCLGAAYGFQAYGFQAYGFQAYYLLWWGRGL